MTREFRIGLVGCGRLAGRGYVPAARLAQGVRLVAVADLVPSRCLEVAPGVPAYDGAGALIAGGEVDAVVVATPAVAHLDDAAAAARAGLPSLVEKPPAAGPAEAAALGELSPPPWIGFNRRFDPGLQRLREAVRAGASPNLRLELSYQRNAWGPHVVADDALDDLGSHLADLARWIAGSEVERARAVELGGRRAHVELEFERGKAELICASDHAHTESFALYDTRGRRLAEHSLSRVRRGLRRLRHPREGNSLVTSLARELEALARAARGGDGAPLATAGDGLAAMLILDAVRSSAAAGGEWQVVRSPAGGS